jgi:Flp pilus assembly protein TadG
MGTICNSAQAGRAAANRAGSARVARSSQRGAVFVEAVIVISILTLGLMGLAFFRKLYVNELHVQRLARAAALAHAMSGCDDEETESWIARDLANFAAVAPTQESQPALGSEPGGIPGDASGFLDQNGVTTQNGEGIVNRITIADLSGAAAVSSSPDATGSSTRFEADLRAISYVSCGDTVEKRQYTSVLDMLESQLRGLSAE